MQQQRRLTPGVEVVDPNTGEVFNPVPDTHSDRGALAVGAATALAMAAKEQAVIKARFERADVRRRNWMQVRQVLLDDCRRPGFAAAALYTKPVGREELSGLSIRFAEAAARAIGNLDCFADLVDQDETQAFYKVGALDLESNLSTYEILTIPKTVERSRMPEGQKLFGTRKNSYGKPVYIVLGTQDEQLNTIRSAIAKSRRNAILAVLPADIREECIAQIHKTQAAEDAQDPAGARKRLVDSFHALGVRVAELEAYLGHAVEQLKPPDYIKLRAIFAALRDGETTWADVMEERGAKPKAPPPPPPKPAATPPQAAATPAASAAPSEEDPVTQAANALRERIRAAETPQALQEMAGAIKDFPKADAESLSTLYAERMREVRKKGGAA